MLGPGRTASAGNKTDAEDDEGEKEDGEGAGKIKMDLVCGGGCSSMRARVEFSGQRRDAAA